MLNCIAVDDEKLVLDLLVDNIKKVPFLSLTARCKNAMEAADILHKEKIDLIFLDIQMPGLSGMELLRSLQHAPMVIFVTAYKQYAFDAFDLNVIDYLLKPVSFDRFLKACNKAHELFNLQQGSNTRGEKPNYFFVYVEYKLIKVSIPEIIYIEAMKDYIKIFLTTAQRPVITKMSMKTIDEKLFSYRFIRIHKSYIVAGDKITAIKRDLVVIGDTELPLSESYKTNLEKLIAL